MEEINQIHQRLFKMAKVFHQFCMQHNLKYFMLGGTMLGAVRHNGIIPWDDDMDFGMPREDYDKLITLREELQQPYTFNTHTKNKDFRYGFCKMYDESTTYIEQMASESQFIGGIYIDIFPLDYIGDDNKKAVRIARKIYKRRKIVSGIFSKGKRSTFIKQLGANMLNTLPKTNKWFDYPYRLLKKYNKENSSYFINAYGAWGEKEIAPKNWFEVPTLYKFENFELCGTKEYDGYLTKLYGNYMVPPPLDKRGGHSIAYIDFDMPYKEYVKKQNNKKEKDNEKNINIRDI